MNTKAARRARNRLFLGAAWSLLAIPGLAAADDSSTNATTLIAASDAHAGESVYVWGLRENTIGQAQSSSEGTVNFALFEDRPLLRPGELVEVIPGLAATQHSGSGKANQYFMRGFNLDHGTDFSVTFDGVPLNLPTHGHGQGYLDLNSITQADDGSQLWSEIYDRQLTDIFAIQEDIAQSIAASSPG